MPPKVKFTKEEILSAAIAITREKGIEALTAREIASTLGASTRPIFTYFDTMDQLKAEVCAFAKEQYRAYIENGLKEEIPFLGVWRQYLAFAQKEPALYRLLFLTRPDNVSGGATEALRFSQELVRPSVMQIYNMDAPTADCFFRDIWLVAFSFATMTVTEDCPYTDEEIFAIGAEISLSVCKTYKEIPGLPRGDYDRDAIFMKLVKK